LRKIEQDMRIGSTSMASDNDESAVPGFEGSLSRTDWSLIQEAASGEEQKIALERLSRRYWPAIYAYIRATGRDVHEAADLSQGFVCDVMLGRNIFETADQKRGRFRSLLLTAIRNYLRQRHRHDTARKRTPDGRPPMQIDAEALAATAVDPGPGGDGGRPRSHARGGLHRPLERIADQAGAGAGARQLSQRRPRTTLGRLRASSREADAVRRHAQAILGPRQPPGP
jgi:RNA polymerase sigma-70 factor (ECF subfamily)